MRKIKIISILGMLILILTGCLSESDRAERVLQKHLKDRYGEEFVIFGMGKRAGNVRRWYEAAVIYPKSYIGTRKENDSYYWGKGFVELNNGMKGGDTYGKVLLNESANEFYGKKLKELFGENYLAVIDVKGPYSHIDFEEEMESRRKSLETEIGGIPPEISGGIYIFGRVENDEDREWYRKQIYEFVQFMKETGTFEYVDLNFTISDERIFSDEFYSNPKLQLDMKKFGNYIEPEGRKIILNKTNKSYKNTDKKNILDRINSLNKGNIDNEFYGIYWLYSKIYSPKYIESHKLKNEIKKEYNSVFDIDFSVEGYKN